MVFYNPVDLFINSGAEVFYHLPYSCLNRAALESYIAASYLYTLLKEISLQVFTFHTNTTVSTIMLVMPHITN